MTLGKHTAFTKELWLQQVLCKCPFSILWVLSTPDEEGGFPSALGSCVLRAFKGKPTNLLCAFTLSGGCEVWGLPCCNGFYQLGLGLCCQWPESGLDPRAWRQRWGCSLHLPMADQPASWAICCDSNENSTAGYCRMHFWCWADSASSSPRQRGPVAPLHQAPVVTHMRSLSQLFLLSPSLIIIKEIFHEGVKPLLKFSPGDCRVLNWIQLHAEKCLILCSSCRS